MPEPTIRPAAAHELGVAAALRGAMAGEMGNDWDARHPGWHQRFANFWRDRQIAGTTQVFYAQAETAIVGMAIASISDEYRGPVFGMPRGYVNGVYVAPEFRRRGIGRALVQAAIDWHRARGCTAVRLRSSDDGRPLYTSLGFVPGAEMELVL